MARTTNIKVRRDTATNWGSTILDAGEFGYDTTNKILKVGDGSTGFSSLVGVKVNEDQHIFTDVTTGNASTSAHGFLKKLDNSTTNFMRGDGTWAAPGGASANANIILTAAGGWPRTTNGCASPAKYESSTNKQNVYTLDFDSTSVEYAQWTIVLPDDYNSGTVTAKFIWMANDATGNGVAWNIQGRAYNEDEALDQSWGTAVTLIDGTTANGAYRILISDATSAITLGGTPAPGEMAQIQVYRDPAHGSDTMGQDAKLIAVKITYSR